MDTTDGPQSQTVLPHGLIQERLETLAQAVALTAEDQIIDIIQEVTVDDLVNVIVDEQSVPSTEEDGSIRS